METAEISIHQVRAFIALQKATNWVTAADLARDAKISPRTARLFTLRLTKLGILDRAEVFPAHRYKISKLAEKRNAAYFLRLRAAARVFGLE